MPVKAFKTQGFPSPCQTRLKLATSTITHQANTD